MLKQSRTTKTCTGLRVRVHLVRRCYEMGVKITPAEMQELVISKDDVALVRVDGLQRIFHEDLSLSGYASRGGVRGVQVRRASKRMKGLGVIPGDVIVGVNGESVETKAKALVVLRRLYKRGVRSFDIKFVSRGRQVTRTYRVPD